MSEHPNPFMSVNLESDSATVSVQPELSFTEGSYVPSVVEGKMDANAKSLPNTRDDADFADSSGLLGAAGSSPDSPPGIFSARRWQSYFNVETSDVMRRIYDSLFIPGEEDFMDKTMSSPDFYGPFWICTTLIFVTAAAASIVEALSQTSDAWYYDVGEVTFSAMLFYGYTVLAPLALYFALRFNGNPLDMKCLLCLYGYSLFIFIPISMLSVVPVEWFRWVILIAGSAESCAFLVINLKRRLLNLPETTMYSILGAVGVVHMMLGLVLKLHFFQYW